MPLVFRTEENLVDEDRDFFIVVRYTIFTKQYLAGKSWLGEKIHEPIKCSKGVTDCQTD
jgi:hypothetical protein